MVTEEPNGMAKPNLHPPVAVLILLGPLLTAYIVDIAIFAGILAVAAVIYLALIGAFAWGLKHWTGLRTARAFWLAVLIGVILAVVLIPLFEGIAGYFRPDGLRLDDPLRLREAYERYIAWSRIIFFALYGVIVFTSGMIGATLGQRMAGHRWVGIAAAAFVAIFLILTLSTVDFFNACVSGESFVFSASC
jgi:hypothetical protein